MIRPGNLIAIGVLTIASCGLVVRATSVLTEDAQKPTVAAGAPGAPIIVRVAGFAFPETITVAAGGTVTWVNDDSAPHALSFASVPAPEPPSVDLSPGAQGTVAFTEPGAHAYVCSIHPSMSGLVVVTATASDPTSPGPTTDDNDKGGY